MTKLNQILAIEKGVKGSAEREVTNVYHQLQKPALFAGITRTYQPRDDDGDPLPPEATLVQIKAGQRIEEAASALTRLFDVVATKDAANTTARGDIVVDGETILANVPVTTLLFLEKQLVDLRTLVTKMPILDPSETWAWDDAGSAYASNVIQTVRTKKVPRNHVKAEATDRHPAQVEMYFEDVPVGTWFTKKFSGALPASQVIGLLTRVDKLLQGVKYAREQANGADVTDVKIGEPLFNYLFA